MPSLRSLLGRTRSISPVGIRSLWAKLEKVPGGRRLFSRMIGMMVPYTGTVSPRVEELKDGYCKVSLVETRRIRNHLNSVHAVALVNIGELAGNLALLSTMPEGSRLIPTGLSIEYVKKARGTISAEARCEPVTSSERHPHPAEIQLNNAAGETVATMQLRTLVGPVT